MPCAVRVLASWNDGYKVHDGTSEKAFCGRVWSLYLGNSCAVVWLLETCRYQVRLLNHNFQLAFFSQFSRLPLSRQLLWGNATEESRWCTPQELRNFRVEFAVNSGPPSEANSSAIPNVLNCVRNAQISPCAASELYCWPVCIAIDSHQVVPAFVVKVVGTYTLERIDRRNHGSWWDRWLWWGHAVTCLAGVSDVDVWCYSRPEDRSLCFRDHGWDTLDGLHLVQWGPHPEV